MSEDFQKIIQEDRETRKRTMWKGTMLEYLEIVRGSPDLAKLSHRRIFDMISNIGITDVDLEKNPRLKRIFKGEKVKSYNFFAEDFYGMEKTINQIVRYFHAASLKGEESRQVLFL